MRIGILTLPLHTNYGGILQAYALQTVLERMGHRTCLIAKEKKTFTLPVWKRPFSYSKRILKNMMGHPFPIFCEQKMNKEEPIVSQNIAPFIDAYIKRRIIGDFCDVKEADYDAIVVGSDQIWRPQFFHPIEHAYLDFTEGWNIKRMAYAVSFGTDNWEYTNKQEKRCCNLAKVFDFLSVREQSGVKLCSEHFGLNVEQVLDPTMLLTRDDYIKLFQSRSTHKSSGNLLCYILDETPEKTEFINKEASRRHLQPFWANSKADIRAPLNERIKPSVEQWLRGFYDADFVITDSFHACVFAIIFEKPFLVIGNSYRGISRITSLLNIFNLENRLYTGKQIDCTQEIDRLQIASILAEKRKCAYAFLEQLS